MNENSQHQPDINVPQMRADAPAREPHPDRTPVIQIEPGALTQNLQRVSAVLAATGNYYKRGERMLVLHHDDAGADVHQVTGASLLADLDALVIWQRFDGRSGEWVRCDAPAKYCKVLLGSMHHRTLPALNAIARQPFLRGDGSLSAHAGYDAATGFFGHFDEDAFAVPPSPSMADAEVALARLDELLAEFPFAGEHDHSAALAALLTAATRLSLDAAPMFHVRAPQIGSGKSYLCELITAFASPGRGAPVAFPSTDEECTKVLISELMRAPAVIEFDNLTTDIRPYKSLCSALTGHQLTGRLLGASKTVRVGTKVLVLSSGNNVGPAGDMTRRCITINLDPAQETPATRSYTRPSLVREVLASRARYVNAALTIVRAWICAGRPAKACTPLASYGDWADLCRQPLLWLGRADPAKPVFEAMAHDPDRELLGRLLQALSRAFAGKPVMVKAMIERAHAGDALADELLDVLQEIAADGAAVNPRRLGNWISTHAGRLVGGMKFVKAPTVRNAVCWQVVGHPADVVTQKPEAALMRSISDESQKIASTEVPAQESVQSVSNRGENTDVARAPASTATDVVEEFIDLAQDEVIESATHWANDVDGEEIEVA
jgi:hypothetical protein